MPPPGRKAVSFGVSPASPGSIGIVMGMAGMRQVALSCFAESAGAGA